MHLAGGDLILGGSDEAEFAAGEAFAVGHTDRGTEDAAGHWTPGVDIAEASFGIEGGTGCVVGEVFEAGLVFFRCAEDAGRGVAGEVGSVLLQPGGGALADGLGRLWIGDVEGLHAGVEAEGVEGVDRECAVATLGASGAAGEHGAGAAGRFRERGVHDLDELGVASGERHKNRVSDATPGSWSGRSRCVL